VVGGKTANHPLPESLNTCHSDAPTNGEKSIFSIYSFTDNSVKKRWFKTNTPMGFQ